MPVPGGKRWVVWLFGAWRVLMFLIPIVLPINHSPAFLVAFLWLQLLCMDGGFWLWE